MRQELVEHVQGALVLWNRARVDLDLPVPLAHSGNDAPSSATRPTARPTATGVGDLRLGADVAPVRPAAAARSPARVGRAAVPADRRHARRSAATAACASGRSCMAAGRRDRLAWAGAPRRPPAAAATLRLRPVAGHRADRGRGPGPGASCRASPPAPSSTWRARSRAARSPRARGRRSSSCWRATSRSRRAGTSASASRPASPTARDAGGPGRGRRPVRRRAGAAAARCPRRRRPGRPTRAATPASPMTAERDDRHVRVAHAPALAGVALAALSGRRAGAVALRYQANQVGDVAVIGNTLGHDCRLAGRRPGRRDRGRLRLEHQRPRRRRLLARRTIPAAAAADNTITVGERPLDGDPDPARRARRSPTRASTGAPPARAPRPTPP